MQKTIIGLIKDRSTFIISLLTILVAVFSVGVSQIELEYSLKSWFRSGDSKLDKYQEFRDHYGADSSLIIMVSLDESISSIESIKTLKAIEEDLWTIPHFVRIESLINFNKTRSEADEIIINPLIPEEYTQANVASLNTELRENRQLRNYLVSEDLKSTVFYSYPRNIKGKEGKVGKEIVLNIQEKIIPKYPHVKFDITGGVRMGEAFETEIFSDYSLLVPLGFGVLLLTLWLFLRNIVLVIVSLGLVAITVVSTLGIQGWLGIKLGLVTAMCPITVMAICVMDLVHVLSGYRKYDNNILKGIECNLKPTLLTTVTTMIGFLSFLSADLYPIANLGVISAIGIGLAWIYTIFLIGPILYIIPLPKMQEVEVKKSALMEGIFNLTQKAPKTIIVSFLTITGICVWCSLLNPIDSNVQNYFSEETDFAKATERFETKIGATSVAEILLESPTDIKDPAFLKKAEKLIQSLEARADISKAISLIHPLKEVHQVMTTGKKSDYRIADTKEQVSQELFFLDLSLSPEKSIRNFHSLDFKELRISLFWHNDSSAQIKKASGEVNQMIAAHGLNGYVTGLAPLVLGIDDYIVSSFIESMLIATTCIALFMMVVFRSVFIGLLSILPNIIVPSFGAAVLYLLDKPFDTGSVLVFSICLGIAIDDTIYFITRTQEQLDKKQSTEKAIQSVLQDAGKILSLTTFILVSVFALFRLGSFTPNHNFAIATVTVLTFALILDLIFLPSLLTVFLKNRRETA